MKPFVRREALSTNWTHSGRLNCNAYLMIDVGNRGQIVRIRIISHRRRPSDSQRRLSRSAELVVLPARRGCIKRAAPAGRGAGPRFRLQGYPLTLPIHRQGWPFIAIAILVDAGAFAISVWLGLVLLPVAIWVVAFFRDPERRPPPGKNIVLSPADGRLLPVISAVPPEE